MSDTDQMNLWHPRVLAKFSLSRVTLVQNYCKRCGRKAEPFTVSDSLWREVVGENGNNERCLRCFTKEATNNAGQYIEWSPRTDTEGGDRDV